jgi:hypothetical protein
MTVDVICLYCKPGDWLSWRLSDTWSLLLGRNLLEYHFIIHALWQLGVIVNDNILVNVWRVLCKTQAWNVLLLKTHWFRMTWHSVSVYIQNMWKQKWVCLVGRFLSWCISLWYDLFNRVVPCLTVIHCWVCLLHITDYKLIILIRRGFRCETIRGETRSIFIRRGVSTVKP